MQKNAGSTTASSANRNTARDAAFLDLARSDLDSAGPASGRRWNPAQRAYLGLQTVEALETLALAFLAAGQVPGHARYEELLKKTPFIEAQEIWFQSHLTLGRLYERQDRRNDARRLYHRFSTDGRLPTGRADDRRARPPREVAVTTAAKTCLPLPAPLIDAAAAPSGSSRAARRAGTGTRAS